MVVSRRSPSREKAKHLGDTMLDLTHAEIAARAAQLEFRTQAFIGGRYVAAATGETFESVSPIDGRMLAQVAACAEQDIHSAVGAARRAFEDGRWSRLAPVARKRILLRLAELVEARSVELALTESL